MPFYLSTLTSHYPATETLHPPYPCCTRIICHLRYLRLGYFVDVQSAATHGSTSLQHSLEILSSTFLNRPSIPSSNPCILPKGSSLSTPEYHGHSLPSQDSWSTSSQLVSVIACFNFLVTFLVCCTPEWV